MQKFQAPSDDFNQDVEARAPALKKSKASSGPKSMPVSGIIPKLPKNSK